jgi:hypothetical protein
LGNGMPDEGPQNPVVQVGIVSWAYEDKCADHRFPGVYTRVSKYTKWIHGTVCERTGELCDAEKSSKSRKRRTHDGRNLRRSKRDPGYGNSNCVSTGQPTRAPTPTRSPTVETPFPTWMPTQGKEFLEAVILTCTHQHIHELMSFAIVCSPLFHKHYTYQ